MKTKFSQYMVGEQKSNDDDAYNHAMNNYSKFVSELNKLTRKTGIVINAVDCLEYYDTNDDFFKKFEYEGDKFAGAMRPNPAWRRKWVSDKKDIKTFPLQLTSKS